MPVDFATQAGHFNGADLQIQGKSLSGTARSKNIPYTIPTVPTAAGTLEFLAIMPFASVISSVRVAFKDTLAANDTNFVTFRVINKTTADSDVIAATDANTTKATGGAAVVAYTTRTLTLANAAGVAVAAQDVLAIRITGAGTLANTLTEGTIIINTLVST
jgi:hypothetical protein